MCGVCGCGKDETMIEHSHGEHSHPEHSHAHGHSSIGSHIHQGEQTRFIQVERDILAKNNEYAKANRNLLAERNIFCINLLSSPGSGKTTLLVNSIAALKPRFNICVIEGDQQTSNDADRIRATGVDAIQINTGKGCHLDAHMVGHAMEKLPLQNGGLLLIENVGNLVCPAAFDLGENKKVVVFSVTEGEDKPLKYPDMFHAADVVLLNKCDLLPYLQFDIQQCLENLQRVNPAAQVIQISATTGAGLDEWCEWLTESVTIRTPASAVST